MSGTIWSKFFWSDWESDPNLRLCSLAAQGLWMRMLCVAATHEPVGYVAVAGKGLDEASLARLTGCPERQLAGLLGELEQNGVFSRDRDGRIYSRRMIADARKARQARRNGLKGGNPSLSNDSAKSRQVKGAVKRADKTQGGGGDKPQSPVAMTPDSITPEEKAVAFPSREQGEKAAAFAFRDRDEKLAAFSGRAGAPKAKPGWHRPKTHLDAANSIIEEIRTHDGSRIAAGGEGAGGDVLMLPAIRAR